VGYLCILHPTTVAKNFVFRFVYFAEHTNELNVYTSLKRLNDGIPTSGHTRLNIHKLMFVACCFVEVV